MIRRRSGRDEGPRSAPALRNRNVRRYLTGQGISHTGMWLQQTAELWLVLQLTQSGTAVGVAAALRWTPLLVFGAYGGLLGDRFSRRHLLISSAIGQAVAAVVLAVAVWSSQPALGLVYVLILLQGAFNAVDNPLRRSFVRDLADDAELSSAISLNSMVGTLARTIGPALGGVAITLLGVAWCFVINALSYGAVIVSLAMLDVARMRPFTPVRREPGQVRAGMQYAWANPRIRVTLIVTGIVSIFAWNWTVLLPVYTTEVLAGDASLYGTLVSLLGAGSVLGAIVSARRGRLGGRYILGSGAVVAAALLTTSLAPTLAFAVIGVVLLGAAGTSFSIGAQALLQLSLEDAMNGRVMALYSIGWLGSKPIGGLIGGWVADLFGARAAFGLGAGVVVTTVVVVAATTRSLRPKAA